MQQIELQSSCRRLYADIVLTPKKEKAMKYSRSAITQLTRWYKQILLKCAAINAMVLVGCSPALAGQIPESDLPISQITDNDWILVEQASEDRDMYNNLNLTIKNGGTFTIYGADKDNSGQPFIKQEDVSRLNFVLGEEDEEASKNLTIENGGNLILGKQETLWRRGAIIANIADNSGTITINPYSLFGAAQLDNHGEIAVNENGSIYVDTLNNYGGINANNGASIIADKINMQGGRLSIFGDADVIANVVGDAEHSSTYVVEEGFDAFGGAIYSNGSISKISGEFKGNSASGGFAHGGAIANSNFSHIGKIEADFINNSADSSGAIFVGYHSSIDTIKGNFIGNTSTENGGAMALLSSTIGSLTGDFENNSSVWGGAIYTVRYDEESNPIYIGEMYSNFTGNSGEYGGAIYNNLGSTIDKLVGNFTNNSAIRGGAIFNRDTITELTGDFTGNSSSVEELSGGAVYNTADGTINLFDSSFKNNIGVQGAAIFVNSGTVSVTAKTKDIEFTNNNTTGAAGGDGTGIQTTEDGTLNLNAQNDHTITINDAVALNGVTQISGGRIILGQDAAASTSNWGTVQFTNTPTLDLANNVAQTTTVASISGNANLNIDLDLSGSESLSDAINITTGGQEGTLTLADLNINGTLKNFTTDILTGETSDITLAISDDLSNQYNSETDWQDKATSDTLTQTATWDDTFSSKTWQERDVTTLEIVDDTKLKYTAETQKRNEQITTGDTITLLNQATQFVGDREYTTDDAEKVHNATADFGTTAAGKFIIRGTADGENTSTVNLNGYSGFTVGEGATLTLDTVALNGAKDEDGSLIDNQAGTVEFSNVKVVENENNIINNDATINMDGYNIISAGIDGNGETNVKSGETTLGNVTQAKINISNGAVLNAEADKVDAALANEGVLKLGGTSNASNITGNGTTVFTSNLENSANIEQTSITVENGKTLTNGGEITVTDIEGAVANNGVFNLNGEDMTLKAAISGTGMTNINGNATWGEGATLANTTIAENGSLDIGTNDVTLSNTAINGTLKMEITDMAKGSSDYTGGHLNVGNLNLGDTSKLSMTIASGLITEKNASTGELDLITASGDVDGDFAEMLSNNRYQITKTESGKYKIAYTASSTDVIEEAGGTQNNINTGEAWDNVGEVSGAAAEVKSVLNDLSQHNAKGYVDALTNLAPTDSMVYSGVTQDFNHLIGEQIASRLYGYGMNSGDVFANRGAWVQGLYNHSKQDSTHSNQGFTGKTAGVAFGLDGDFDDYTTVGIGYAHGNTDVDSLGRDTDVKENAIFAYAKYQPSRLYVRGMVNYGFAKYEEKAKIGNISNKADYDVDNYGARAYVGYELPQGFIPEAGLRYTHIKRSGYTDSIGQQIKSDNLDILTAAVGASYSANVITQYRKWTPKARLALTYDIVSDDSNAIVNIGDTTYDIKGKRLNRLGVEGGIGADISLENWDLSAEYDLGIRKDYTSHAGMLKAKYNF